LRRRSASGRTLGHGIVVVLSAGGVDVQNGTLDRLRRDAVRFVVRDLDTATPFGLADGLTHRGRDVIGVHQYLTARVACGTAYGLDERARAAQKALFVSIQDRDQADLRQIQTFPEQVDANQYVELAGAQIAQ